MIHGAMNLIKLCFASIMCQLSFHASSIWGRNTAKFCSCIPINGYKMRNIFQLQFRETIINY